MSLFTNRTLSPACVSDATGQVKTASSSSTTALGKQPEPFGIKEPVAQLAHDAGSSHVQKLTDCQHTKAVACVSGSNCTCHRETQDTCHHETKDTG
jgi:hypothetical protein